MDLAECKKKIDRFLSKDNVQPLIVDVQNQKDWSDLMMHYNVGTNNVIKASDYCKKDEFPQIDTLFHELGTKQGTSFVTGLSSFLKLLGEQELRKVISEILSMTTAGHVIVVTYQCHRYMNFKDPRLQPRIAAIFICSTAQKSNTRGTGNNRLLYWSLTRRDLFHIRWHRS